MISPGKAWYKAMDRLYAKKLSKEIQKELLLRPDLTKILSTKISSFIIWAGQERLIYVPDIDAEVDDFIRKELGSRIRAYSINVKEWKLKTNTVFVRDNYTCQYCGIRGGILECDHIIPFSQGGSDELDNLTTACRKCNRSKRDKSVEEFKEYQKIKIPA